MTSLRMPSGYVLTIGQFSGSLPVGTVECRLCVWRDGFDVPVEEPVEVGQAVTSAVRAYTAHTCDVRPDMQDSPAVQLW